MSKLSETRKAIRELPDGLAVVHSGKLQVDGYDEQGNPNYVRPSSIPTSDLKELEAAYTKLEDAALDVIKQAQFSIPSNARRVSGMWFVVEKLKEVLESREDPERVELASAPSGGELSGR